VDKIVREKKEFELPPNLDMLPYREEKELLKKMGGIAHGRS